MIFLVHLIPIPDGETHRREAIVGDGSTEGIWLGREKVSIDLEAVKASSQVDGGRR